jgi:hypothetical protein
MASIASVAMPDSQYLVRNATLGGFELLEMTRQGHVERTDTRNIVVPLGLAGLLNNS